MITFIWLLAMLLLTALTLGVAGLAWLYKFKTASNTTVVLSLIAVVTFILSIGVYTFPS